MAFSVPDGKVLKENIPLERASDSFIFHVADEKSIVCFYDQTIKVIDIFEEGSVADREFSLSFSFHHIADSIQRAAAIEDRKFIIATPDDKIRVVDIDTGEERVIHRITPQEEVAADRPDLVSMRHMAISGNKVAIVRYTHIPKGGTSSSYVELYDLKTGTVSHLPTNSKTGITGLFLRGHFLAAQIDDDKTAIWCPFLPQQVPEEQADILIEDMEEKSCCCSCLDSFFSCLIWLFDKILCRR
jgi:hypothetical protein